MKKFFAYIKSLSTHHLALDQALFYSLLARTAQMVAGAITLVFIIYFFHPVEQGFYYTFNSVLNMELFFELGLTFVILQTTSHYFINLTWQENGEISGNVTEQERLLAFLKKSAYWYIIAALAFGMILIPAGGYFFSLKKELPIHFHWWLPWILVVAGSALNLSLSPFLASIEGSGQVAKVYRFRTQQLFLASGASWIVLAAGGGLYMLVA